MSIDPFFNPRSDDRRTVVNLRETIMLSVQNHVVSSIKSLNFIGFCRLTWVFFEFEFALQESKLQSLAVN